MNHEVQQGRHRILWGVLIIAIGVIFLIDRTELFMVGNLATFWPIVMLVFGVARLVPPTTPRHVASGIWSILFAAWFFVSYNRLWGLTFHNSWPVLIIISGLSMVIRAFMVKYSATQEEK